MYIQHLIDIFDEVKRILKPEGTCWIVIGDTYSGSGGAGGDYDEGGFREGQPRYKQGKVELPAKSLCQIPSRLAIAMVDNGWILRNEIIWAKPNCMPSSATDRFTVDFEKVLFFSKTQKYYFSQQFEKQQEISIKRAFSKNWLDKRKDKDNKEYAISSEAQDKTYERMRADIADGKIPTRNMRCVWEISTKGFSGSHFAVFPEELVRICIDAGCPDGNCKSCGQARIKEYTQERIPTRPGRDTGTKKSGQDNDPNKGLHNADVTKRREIITRPSWKYKNCGCNAEFYPGIVLDPFMGAGTTSVVARKKMRDYIGIEVNPEYVKMANKRMQEDVGTLF